MLRILVIAAALALAFAPIPASIVERYYSNTTYPLIQTRLTTLSNLTAFAWFDVLIAIVFVWWILRLVQDFGL